MASFDIVGPSLGSNKEQTYDKKYMVNNGSLVNAKTKSKMKSLKTEGRGKNSKLVLTKYYEKIVRDNWDAYVKDKEEDLPLRLNANKVYTLLKEELNIAPSNVILEQLKPLMREFVVEYNTTNTQIPYYLTYILK